MPAELTPFLPSTHRRYDLNQCAGSAISVLGHGRTYNKTGVGSVKEPTPVSVMR